MNESELYSILNHIRLGVNEKLYYDYNGEALPLRPISSWEYDQAFSKSLKYASKETAETLVKNKIKLINLEKEIDINNDLYKELHDFYNEVDYWIVFFSMKDFQPEDFSFPDFGNQFAEEFDDYDEMIPKGYYIIKKMEHIHNISRFITSTSTKPREVIREIIKSSSGRILASIHYKFHVPISDELWKLTPLQSNFIILSHPDAPKHFDTLDEVPGLKSGMTMNEILKVVRGIRQLP